MNLEFSEILSDSFEYFDDSYEAYSNMVDPNLIIQGVGSVAGIVGKASESKQKKEISKTELQKQIDTRCGKDKSNSLNKTKKATYLSCKQGVLNNYDIVQQQGINEKKEQRQMLFRMSEENKKRNTYLIIGGILLIVGYLYFKNKK
jgi:hypothetical protein